jgi:hypothetical protein
MGVGNSKETVIAQNAVGTSNIEELKHYASITYYLTASICVFIIIAGVCLFKNYYEKCHGNWIEQEVARQRIQRTGSWFRRREQEPPQNCMSA